MSDTIKTTEPYQSRHKIRVVTAASLFDGHDAAINVMRRILQASGAEVIHLGHNRSVHDVVKSAIEEDAQAIAVSSYQGGHMEYFKYMYDMLAERGAGHVKLFGGGGGVIVPREIDELHAYGITRIFSPADGTRMGLQGMINCILQAADYSTVPASLNGELDAMDTGHPGNIATLITVVENSGNGSAEQYKQLSQTMAKQSAVKTAPVIGMTGTGGAGKSSLCDELVHRFVLSNPEKTIAVLSIDPTKRKTGGALLGDRIRFNTAHHKNVYMRSMATRGSHSELSAFTQQAVDVLKAGGYDMIIVESAGIGQGDADILDVCDISVYVMTSEYGAASQLEKIEMIDFADVIAINKYDRKGSEDALRDVRKQYRRSHKLPPDSNVEEYPVFGTMASRFHDDGVNALYSELIRLVTAKLSVELQSIFPSDTKVSAGRASVIPPERIAYLDTIAASVTHYKAWVNEQCENASVLYQLQGSRAILEQRGDATTDIDKALQDVNLDPRCQTLLDEWPALKEQYRRETFEYTVRDKVLKQPLYRETLSGLKVPRVVLPRYESWGEILRFLLLEHVPGHFPFTAGLFPLKRTFEDPKRMFAGEGPPIRTNKRFHLLCEGELAQRLSTAFDSVTLYGEDPETRPDIFGKVGEAGVSICTLDDMKILYSGFDLCAPTTSVSMTINGPAPIILAFFFNTAIDQQVEAFTKEHGHAPSAQEYQDLRERTLHIVRGTVQADILKEDQAQNTCIFSTAFALKMMGDVQEYFIQNKVRNYYSVSISGYHIAEAGANPLTQLALTLSNGFTYVEYYLSRGMKIDDFAPNLSFFFSNGLDAEYSVIGRVARRIWSIAVRDVYGGNKRSQQLKYHIQTSGRSLHAQEIQYNDIRTTLQALMALYDNCNSLHTNAYDEAITTPTEESVRRAMAIQLIINRELGLTKNENPLQGAYIIEELTELVEEAVLAEFRRISERGGVLGAMELQYQRSKIQEESLYYETLKHNGELPIIGVNTYLNPETQKDDYRPPEIELRRATLDEKNMQLDHLHEFQDRGKAKRDDALKQLQKVAMDGGNIFAELMETVRVASLGQIVHALYDVGGAYRRNM